MLSINILEDVPFKFQMVTLLGNENSPMLKLKNFLNNWRNSEINSFYHSVDKNSTMI